MTVVIAFIALAIITIYMGILVAGFGYRLADRWQSARPDERSIRDQRYARLFMGTRRL